MGGRGGTYQIRGRRAEEFIARQLEEPIGDSGQPWEGDVLTVRGEPPVPQVSESSVNLSKLSQQIERFEERDTLGVADMRRLNELRNELRRRPRTRQILELLNRIEDILDESR